jgi:hypothetical protein
LRSIASRWAITIKSFAVIAAPITIKPHPKIAPPMPGTL